MQNLANKISVGTFLLSLVFLLFYSFTQVDLGLALTRFAELHTIQRAFQEIGFFRRDLSALLFIAIFTLLCASYLFILRQLYKGHIKTRSVFVLSIVSACILFFSYNAFSYDLFNYIFDAKIITFYNENPYVKKALDYPSDPMLGFMRWTHRVYPYGPVWLGATVPISLISFNSIILAVVFFKGLAVFSYLGSVYFLKKIIENMKLSRSSFHLGLFALNPLVIIESLVSAHNDIFMLFLLIVGFYSLTTKKTVLSSVFLLLSIGVKFATALLLPVFAYVFVKRNTSINWQKVITFSFILMSIAVILATFRTNFQPWYLLYILPFATLSKKTMVVVTSITLSLLALLQYLPYIYTGNYDPPIPLILAGTLSSSLIFAAILLVVLFLSNNAQEID